MPGLRDPPTSLADAGCGERQGRGTEGRMDRGTAVPQPVLAGTDTHHGTRGPVTLQRFSLRMLGSAGGVGICPLSHLHAFLQGPQPSAYCKGGCFFWGFLGWFFNHFYLLFLFPCFPLAPLSVAPAQTPQAAICTAQQSSLSQRYFLPPHNRVRKFRFPGERGLKERGSRPTAPSEQERVSPDMP